jgi:hypothetical protein
MNRLSDRVSLVQLLDIKRLDATTYQLGCLRKSWKAMANSQRIDALQVAVLSLSNIADRQRPPGQRRRQRQANGFENFVLLSVIALISSTLAYAYGTEVGQSRCPLGNAVPPAVVR